MRKRVSNGRPYWMIIELFGQGKKDCRWSDSHPWWLHIGPSMGESRPKICRSCPTLRATGNQGPICRLDHMTSHPCRRPRRQRAAAHLTVQRGTSRWPRGCRELRGAVGYLPRNSSNTCGCPRADERDTKATELGETRMPSRANPAPPSLPRSSTDLSRPLHRFCRRDGP